MTGAVRLLEVARAVARAASSRRSAARGGSRSAALSFNRPSLSTARRDPGSSLAMISSEPIVINAPQNAQRKKCVYSVGFTPMV
jgi:hypothetical protein